MNQKSGLIGLAALVIVILGALAIFKEADDGPIENMAEDLDDAIDEIDG